MQSHLQSVPVDIGSQLNAAAEAVDACLQAWLGCSIATGRAAGKDVPTGTPSVEMAEHFPAASSSQDSITFLKFCHTVCY